MLKDDLEATGISYVDKSGRYADFHSLRHTTGTLLAAAGLTNSIIEENTQKLEAAVGFEPTNNGFANRPLRPLGYAAELQIYGILPGNRLFRNIFYRWSA